jgi:protein SCO1/2/putative membrane protein
MAVLLAVAGMVATARAQEEPPAPAVSDRQAETTADSATDPVQETPKAETPIVIVPERGADGPVVQLDPNAEKVPWNPLEIGDFTLIDQDGNQVTAEDLRGKPWVASFIFTRCAIACPNLVKKIYDLNKRVQDVDVRFVTITVDPENDTVAKMKQYADIYQATPERWLFLTGDKDEVYRLIRHGFKVAAWEMFGTDRLPGFEFAHSLSLVHVGPDGKVLGMYGSADEKEVRSLERVLAGKMETPPENRPVPPNAVPEPNTPAPLIAPPAGPQSPAAAKTPAGQLPAWAARLPATNAMLNALATVLLLVGFTSIQAGYVNLHKKLMLYAFGVSVAFLACYLTYHFALQTYTGTHGKKFDGDGTWATVYYAILISHVLLAMTVPVLAPLTIYRGLKKDWDRHRRIAKITFPIWLYVSVTGVIIYGMLYHWPK